MPRAAKLVARPRPPLRPVPTRGAKSTRHRPCLPCPKKQRPCPRPDWRARPCPPLRPVPAGDATPMQRHAGPWVTETPLQTPLPLTLSPDLAQRGHSGASLEPRVIHESRRGLLRAQGVPRSGRTCRLLAFRRRRSFKPLARADDAAADAECQRGGRPAALRWLRASFRAARQGRNPRSSTRPK